MYQYVPVYSVKSQSFTSLYLLELFLFHLVQSCTAVYHLVQPCTVLVQGGTRLYILVHTAEIWIMSVHTGVYQKDEFGTEIGTSLYIPVHTVLYRCTGFQMLKSQLEALD